MTGSLTQAEILLRKSSAKPAKSGPALDSDEMAMAKAFVRAGHEILGMRVRVLSASARTETGIEQLTPVFADHALCLAGRGNGETGVIALSLELVTAIVEKSATGEVGTRAIPDRAGTSVDAFLAEPLLRAMLENMSLVCSPDIRPWIAGVELAKAPSKTDDLEFQIAEGAHRVVMLRFQIDGAREGELVALIPQPCGSGGRPGGTPTSGPNREDPAAGFRRKLLDSRTTLRADLISLDVPLAEFRNWTLGSEIQIPGEAIGAIRLTQNGDVDIAKGRLGQASGNRAVRLDLPSPEIQPPAPLVGSLETPTVVEPGDTPPPDQDDPKPHGPPQELAGEPVETPVA